MVDRSRTESRTLSSFLDSSRERLERALVARFGVDDGLDASAAAVEYAVRFWDRVGPMDNPTGYLFRVGETHGRRSVERRKRDATLLVEQYTHDQPVDIDLQRALVRLDPIQRVAVVLVHAHGHTYVEAAEILEVPVSTFNNHLRRGLSQLRRELEQDD